MTTTPRVFSLVALLLATSCASPMAMDPIPPIPGSLLFKGEDTSDTLEVQRVPKPSVSTPCLPPGVPALSTLVRIGGLPATGRARTSEGQVEPIRLFRSYWSSRIEDDTLVLYIVTANGYIATVDVAPHEPDVPAWYDTGMMTETGEYIADGRPSCRWERAGTPRRPGVQT